MEWHSPEMPPLLGICILYMLCWACLQLFGGLADSLEGGLSLWVAALVRMDQQTQAHVALLDDRTPGLWLQPHDCIRVCLLSSPHLPALPTLLYSTACHRVHINAVSWVGINKG